MNIRKHGQPPFKLAAIHGGPGAPGYMAPLARGLSRTHSCLEPLQTRDSLEGQIEELRDQITTHADPPVILIGSSWGAVLSLFLAARYPELSSKLILIGSAVFDAQSSALIEGRRRERMSREQQLRLDRLNYELQSATGDERARLFAEWGRLLSGADIYDGNPDDVETIEVQPHIFQKVWPEFVALRDKPGYLREEFSKIKQPTVVIHGEYDPHPFEGIRPFLESCLENATFHLLPECGHYPWIENRARDGFFDILREEIAGQAG